MNEVNRNVVLVLSQYSVVVKGFERKLKELGYGVEILAEDFNRIEGMAEWAGVIVFYLPGDIMDDIAKRSHLEKMISVVREKGRNAVMIGEAKYHKDLTGAIPWISDYIWFDRPVDMKKFADAIENQSLGTGPDPGEEEDPDRGRRSVLCEHGTGMDQGPLSDGYRDRRDAGDHLPAQEEGRSDPAGL